MNKDVPLIANSTQTPSTAELDNDGDVRRKKPQLLFVGFAAEQREELSAVYGSDDVNLAFSSGGTDDLLTLGMEHFEAMAIQVDCCDLYGPIVIKFLRERNALVDGAEVVALTNLMVPNFVEQLRSSGCTDIVSATTNLALIFPKRALL